MDEHTPGGAASRLVACRPGFSLATTCGPVAWGKNRWPNLDWSEGSLTWAGWEGERAVWRQAQQLPSGDLRIAGSGAPASDAAWAAATLGIGESCPPFIDPILDSVRWRYPGLGVYAAGSLYEGLVSAIVGQSISVVAAAITEARLAALCNESIAIGERQLWPLPRAEQLAAADPALVRRSGVTGRRAAALVAVGQAEASGRLPTTEECRRDPGAAGERLRGLPLVGPWTAAAALLWGVGAPDIQCTGDVALLRAARRVYEQPAMTLRELDGHAEGWRPARAWAARLLWTDLLGSAPIQGA